MFPPGKVMLDQEVPPSDVTYNWSMRYEELDTSAYRVCGEDGDKPSAMRVKLPVGNPPASLVQVGVALQVTPLSVLRKTPLLDAAKMRAGVAGVTTRRPKRTPANVAVANSVQGVAHPSVVLSTPLP